jgi:hypothetical protein
VTDSSSGVEADRQPAQDWRLRAQALWRLSCLLDDLSVRLRNMALHCDQEAAILDELVAEQRD